MTAAGTKCAKVTHAHISLPASIEAISASRSSREPPPLVLNRHCAVCDFQPRCRALAIEHDDLSLLTAMTGKERALTATLAKKSN